ncbi:HAD-IC family P-type ATPase [Leptolyngbya sp. AN02str]|uniref:HAD-IC family P-type ATPase n=1 Tax=Leptolyngbya sp. AN02str TaxID=3423363 RepID=UPI003D323B76
MSDANARDFASLKGLSTEDVGYRRSQGQGNNVSLQNSRSYLQIFQENLFTFINAVFIVISVVLFALQRPGDALLVVIVIFGGIIINIYQEIWAKHKLDQIALLSRPKATVRRNGIEQDIDPTEIVLGDILVLRPGDQILVDGHIVGQGHVEVDESLLTGESDLIFKADGAPVFSGSFCASGMACYEAHKVGKETVAYQLMAGARAFRQALTPLQREINVVIRVFMLIACFLWILIAISFLSRSYSFNDVVQRAAVVAGLVPAGLLLAITLAYGLGAVRMLGQDVLIQQANAVESLSHVDVLCLDKTGTLTTNQLTLDEIYPLALGVEQVRSLLGDVAANATAGNRTTEAIAQVCFGQQRRVLAEMPFSSARKWSAIALADATLPGVYVLGAPEVLAETMQMPLDVMHQVEEFAAQGLRVVLFAYSPNIHALKGTDLTLPADLSAIALLCFGDRLRAEAYETLQGFAQAEIEVKIISGDNPQTVRTLAQQVGLDHNVSVISGQELATLDEAQFARAAQTGRIFGRITPQQKAQLILSLRNAGRYVAMIGDGVNDILALKQANLAIAMESGSKATRGVADIVLLKDSFAALPHAFLEGQRIRSGIQDIMKLFMVRVFCITLLIFATAIVTDSFPLENKQSAIVTLVGVGLPTIFIPVWAKPVATSARSMVRSMLHFVIPATLSLTLISLLVYLLFLVSVVLDLPPQLNLSQVDYSTPRSALVTILILGELCLILFLKPPTRAWVGGEPFSGDWRYTLMALVLLGVYILIIAVPPLRDFFELTRLSRNSYLFIGLVAVEWCLILRFIWRSRFLDKFLGVDLT